MLLPRPGREGVASRGGRRRGLRDGGRRGGSISFMVLISRESEGGFRSGGSRALYIRIMQRHAESILTLKLF